MKSEVPSIWRLQAAFPSSHAISRLVAGRDAPIDGARIRGTRSRSPVAVRHIDTFGLSLAASAARLREERYKNGAVIATLNDVYSFILTSQSLFPWPRVHRIVVKMILRLGSKVPIWGPGLRACSDHLSGADVRRLVFGETEHEWMSRVVINFWTKQSFLDSRPVSKDTASAFISLLYRFRRKRICRYIIPSYI